MQDRNPDDGRDPFESAQDSGEPKKSGSSPRHIGRVKEVLGSKLHAVCDGLGRPVRLLLTAGNLSDIVGGELLKDLQDSGEPKKGGLPRATSAKPKEGLAASYMPFVMALGGR